MATDLKPSPGQPRSKSVLDQQTIKDNVVLLLHWDDEKAEISSAIAMAESRGRVRAVGRNKDGSRDRGLWQINDKAHPDVSDACAFEAHGCAIRAMARISDNGTDWGPWTTYKSGAYKRYMGKTKKSDADALRGDTGPGPLGKMDNPLSAVADVLAKLVDAIKDAFDWLTSSETWLTVGKIIAGAIMVAFALNGLYKQATGSSPMGGAAKLAATRGAAK